MASWAEARTGINTVHWRHGEVYLAQITPAASPQTKLEGLVVATSIKGTLADRLEGVYLDIPFISGEARYTPWNLKGLKRALDGPESEGNLYNAIIALTGHNNRLALAESAEPRFDKLLDLAGISGGGMHKLRQRLCWSRDAEGLTTNLLYLKAGGEGWQGVYLTLNGVPQEVEQSIESLHANVSALHAEPRGFQSWKAEPLRAGKQVA